MNSASPLTTILGKRTRRVFLLLAMLLSCTATDAKSTAQATRLLRLAAAYPRTVCPTPPDSFTTYSYAKSRIDVEKRNVTMAAVPTLFYLMRDKRRHFLSESYVRLTYHHDKEDYIEPLIYLSTIYHRHRTLPTLKAFLLPTPYQPTLFADWVLSPLCLENQRFYRYRVYQDEDNVMRLFFRSRTRNTQLLRRGWARIDRISGRIINFRFEGEYDMVNFVLDGEMGDKGIPSLFPKTCTLQAKFSFMGNRVRAKISTFPQLPNLLPGQTAVSYDPKRMENIRPIPLDSLEQTLAATYPLPQTDSTTTHNSTKHKESWAKRVLWDMIGDNILNRISARFGENNQGYVRFNPLFNPLYMGYSDRRGFYYKMKMQGNYRFNNQSELSTTIRLAYSFKQKQLFFNLPVEWKFNKQRNGFVLLQLSNGNRITDSRVLEAIKGTTTRDTIAWDSLGLDYFKDSRLQLSAGIDLQPSRLGIETGVVFHRRSAVNPTGFDQAQQPRTYHSFAPFVKLTWRPLTDRVPLAFSVRYDQGLEWLQSNMHYSRLELDGQYIRNLSRMRSLSMRVGSGFYLDRAGKTYFLDYHNFHENYVPGGWNDDWSGEFEVLNSNWYNASQYYARGNLTYESPMLFLAYMPLLGHIVEKERLYFGALAVSHYVPYFELGYSFTNRLFSVGIFTGVAPHHFEGVELKFGFELFNNW